MTENGISIVILTKDTREILENLLESIEKDQSLQSFLNRIIVVDNASADGTEEAVKRRFPKVMYVRNEENLGFARAVNHGSSFADGEYILFLNSDTHLIPGEFVKMIGFMDRNGDAAICGPQLVYPDMKPQRSFAAIPSLTAEFIPGRSPHVVSLATADGGQETGCNVDSLIGAALFVRRKDFEELNGFDERFFFFLEETDLCLRARLAGKKVVFFPDARIVHLQGKTVRRNWIKGRMEYNISLYKFIRKHHSGPYYSAFTAVRFAKALLYAAAFPLFFLGGRLRLKYAYHLALVSWHLRGCPENAGLR